MGRIKYTDVSYMIIPQAVELFDLSHTVAKELILEHNERPYEALKKIKDFTWFLIEALSKEDGYEKLADDVLIARDSKISDKASIEGPAIIGKKPKYDRELTSAAL